MKTYSWGQMYYVNDACFTFHTDAIDDKMTRWPDTNEEVKLWNCLYLHTGQQELIFSFFFVICFDLPVILDWDWIMKWMPDFFLLLVYFNYYCNSIRIYKPHVSIYHICVYISQSWLPFTVANFYISLHCFVVKFHIQVFKNVHGLK